MQTGERAMPAQGSVTRWIRDLKVGDPDAAEKIWARYFDVLVRLARKRLHGAQARIGDEEDVALSALKSLCLGARRGKFPLLSDRDSLWRLLVVLTARKAFDQKQHERRQKRGGGQVRSEDSDGPAARGLADQLVLEQIIGREPSPEFVASMADECRHLFDMLDDDGLRSICLWKMEGYTNDEIAEKLRCTTRTVERKLGSIRTQWIGGASR